MGLDPARKGVVFVGDMDKDIDEMLQPFGASAQICTAVDNGGLVLVGQPGSQSPSSASWPSVVHPIGRRHGMELVRLIASADLFLWTSRCGTFWFPPLEAMACSVASVASDVGAVPAMIPEDGVQGRRVMISDRETHQFLSDAGESLAAGAVALPRDDVRLAVMGATGRAHVGALSEARQGKRLGEVFRAVLECCEWAAAAVRG